MKTNIIFMGTPEFSVPILEALIASPHTVSAVSTQADKPAGRGQQLAVSPVKMLAMKHRIPVFQPESLREPETVQMIRGLKPSLIVVAAYGKILTPEVLAIPEHGCVNVHPSLLPKYRGPSPIATPIIEGQEFTGVTIMLVEARVDSGPILSQESVPIDPSDTTGSLNRKLAQVGARLLLNTLPVWLDGKIKAKPQNEDQATYTRMITKEDGEIDWNLPASVIERKARAFDPWPGCYTSWQGKRLKLCRVALTNVSLEGAAGTVVTLDDNTGKQIGVITGLGVLTLVQVQLEGKREVPVRDFARGQRNFVGSRLPR